MNKKIFIFLLLLVLTGCTKLDPHKQLESEWKQFVAEVEERMMNNQNELPEQHFSNESGEGLFLLNSIWSSNLYFIDKKNLELVKKIELDPNYPLQVYSTAISPKNNIWVPFTAVRKNDIMWAQGRWIWILKGKTNSILKKIRLNKIRNPVSICFDKKHAYVAAKNNGLYFGIAKIDLNDYTILEEKSFDDTGYVLGITCNEEGVFISGTKGIYKLDQDMVLEKLTRNNLTSNDFSYNHKDKTIYVTNKIDSEDYEIISFNTNNKTFRRFRFPNQYVPLIELNKAGDTIFAPTSKELKIFNLNTKELETQNIKGLSDVFAVSSNEFITRNKIYNHKTKEFKEIKDLPPLDWRGIIELAPENE